MCPQMTAAHQLCRDGHLLPQRGSSVFPRLFLKEASRASHLPSHQELPLLLSLGNQPLTST